MVVPAAQSWACVDAYAFWFPQCK
ncbi:uncharacterized protein G2W53_037730 [Senna tora]|uniref:Uncharacterized protein n=1 Tax=Senna tora TaxID=362788 RepID=A0A834SKP2_9FABA|nr:uncharacterized protein G2W53_037730 [Senna tora]